MIKTPITNAVQALSGSATNTLRDIKPPVEIPSGWAWVLWVVGCLAVAALAYQAWRYWQKKRAETPRVPVVPAHVRAKQRLAQALAIIGQPKEFCILVSDTVRWYLEERFDFHAPERTTEEFLHELRSTSLLTPDQKESLVEFLNRCDLVKFARYEPGEAELRDLHASAVRLVQETEPQEAATAPPPDPHSALRTPHSALPPGPPDANSALRTPHSALPPGPPDPNSALRTPHSALPPGPPDPNSALRTPHSALPPGPPDPNSALRTPHSALPPGPPDPNSALRTPHSALP